MCYGLHEFYCFGAAVGSIPAVFLLAIIAFLSLLAYIAGKLKEVDMKKVNNKKTVTAKFVIYGRKFCGEFLLILVAISAGWTAGNVQLQLLRVA